MPHCTSPGSVSCKPPNDMVNKVKFDIYKNYGGDIDGLARVGRDHEKQLFDNNDDWSIISNLLQDIYLIKNDRCSDEFKEKTLSKLELTVDKDVIPLIWSFGGQK